MIEDILRRYSKNEEVYHSIIGNELKGFTLMCDSCIDYCNKKTARDKCFADYLQNLGYSPIERRVQNIPVIEERRAETIEEKIQTKKKKPKK